MEPSDLKNPCGLAPRSTVTDVVALIVDPLIFRAQKSPLLSLATTLLAPRSAEEPTTASTPHVLAVDPS